MIRGFQFAVGTVGRIGVVMEAAVGEGAAEPLVKEQEQERDLHTFWGELVGVPRAVACQQSVALQFAEIVAELVQPVGRGGNMEGSEDGLMDLPGRRAAHGIAAVK